MEFAEWFARMCVKHNITQTEVARQIGTTAAATSYWMRGDRYPKKTTLIKLEELFGEKFEEEKKLLVNDDEELTAYLELLRTRPECRALLSTAAGASKKEVEENVRFIEALRNAKKSD